MYISLSIQKYRNIIDKRRNITIYDVIKDYVEEKKCKNLK